MRPQDISQLIERFDLNLKGLTVYTEAASGAYLLCPILAAAAGAERVYAQTRDSRFGEANEILEATMSAAEKFGVANRIEVLKKRCHRSLAAADIVTNSGFVRPIDKDLIAALKPTAVIPLMWETWEFRSSDFDLDDCQERGILVLGTDEQKEPCDMRLFIGLCGLKLLFDLGFDGGKVLLLGNASIPGGTIVDYLRRAGIDVTWFSAEAEGDLDYGEFAQHFQSRGSEYDIMLLAEHKHRFPLLGSEGLLDFKSISEINSALKIGVISGNLNVSELVKSGLRYLPGQIAPTGFMSYQPYMMGPRPVLTLYAGGLKVGEAMARARISGLSPKESVVAAMAGSPAMDFPGGLSWL